ncbi:cofilin/ADF [Monocercomonoides exilis]|uniref:cofilin/ADF n=1 Tax=Monocercomonoides exilis TaxID=2049356 RepID=UPI003559AC3D|nr:cofilin/ADF [Monocercomonoides exilis]|eukprot:MONOS_14103.1-p1 / transcript=MONOS_14103.1 / gene=MONOS_14103 / organism=Monocercomonoides_exilis_PA203 / gene_product=cofilin/ADF / transcript_product=cofilin/ADF / location=Mono_scaffold00939:3609-4205(-) / protein_length=134 / sequence_SO=supercontig / SO=protein_coding / is_pseudo=false
MQIGIVPTDEAVAKFNEFKFAHKLYYVIYKIQNDKDIVVDVEGEKGKTFADLKAALPENEPRYIIVNHEYAVDTTTRTKIFLSLYTPSTTPVRKRMLYASAKSAIKSAFTGIQNDLDVDESFREEDLTEKATRV